MWGQFSEDTDMPLLLNCPRSPWRIFLGASFFWSKLWTGEKIKELKQQN